MSMRFKYNNSIAGKLTQTKRILTEGDHGSDGEDIEGKDAKKEDK